MKSRSYWGVILGLVLLATVEQAFASSYAYMLDSVSVTGQLNFVDDFNGSSLSSDWEITEGTVVVAGGFATLSNPGTKSPGSVGGVSFIEEDSFFQSTFSILDGGGSFVTTAIWQEGAPRINEFFSFEIVDHTATGLTQTIGLFVAHLAPNLAGAVGLPTGPIIFFNKRTDLDSGGATESFSGVSIPSDTTAPIMLRLSFDDSSDLFTGSYNLGEAWVGFSPVSFDPGGAGSFHLGLNGESIQVVPLPAAFWLFGSSLFGLLGLARGKKSG
ncbi:MAG: hypothetical protein KDI49_11355 [Gammaproteobacteria bacterium]|nr:hypothetical protein [Gammaproteobacteria bacterium]